ncbi:hypothetical protein B1J93_08950 [Leptospira kirschneri serovar Pomona]|uniref:Uncharacterized protein n=1 Tax=Leptospira kirschneri serovar Pomona TaxID=561005 RepID=A0A1T1DQC2_9LEPT|nr:hypothetical protein B1J93_08950 [Leptospira kirschneri serovar Pomona]
MQKSDDDNFFVFYSSSHNFQSLTGICESSHKLLLGRIKTISKINNRFYQRCESHSKNGV